MVSFRPSVTVIIKVSPEISRKIQQFSEIFSGEIAACRFPVNERVKIQCKAGIQHILTGCVHIKGIRPQAER